MKLNKERNMNVSVKVCDFCDTCVYEGEYEIQNNEVKCIMCIEEEKEKHELSSGRMGDIRPLERQNRIK